MPREELKRSLDRLRAEIGKLGEDDEAIRRRMQRLVAGLERQLERTDDEEEDEQLLDTVRDYIEQFEVEHPRLTGTLNRVMVALSNLGI